MRQLNNLDEFPDFENRREETLIESYFKSLITSAPFIWLLMWYFEFADLSTDFFSPYLIFEEHEWSRIFTGIIIIGPPNLNNWIIAFIFYIIIQFSNIGGAKLAIIILYSIFGAYLSWIISPYPYLGSRAAQITEYILVPLFILNRFEDDDQTYFYFRLIVRFFRSIPYICLFFNYSRENLLCTIFLQLWGHVFYFIDYVLPENLPLNPITPPKFLEKLFGVN